MPTSAQFARFAGRAAEARSLPPVEALERLLRLRFAYLPEILPVAGALEAAAVNGDEGAAAWRDRMGDRWELFAAAVDRIDRDGRLAQGWSVPAATAWGRAGRSRPPPTGSGPAPSPRPSPT
jgi:hypothetical protein